MKLFFIAALLLLLGACSSAPEVHPQPEPLPVIVLCELPEGMAQADSAPAAPRGEYSQRDVALYVIRLHQWGDAANQRLQAIYEWSEDCVQRARL